MVGRDVLGGSPMVRPRQVSVMAMGGLAGVGLSRARMLPHQRAGAQLSLVLG